MLTHNDDLFVIYGPGTSLLHYAFDEERAEVTVTCRGCGCTSVTPTQPEPGQQVMTLEHESDCQVLTLIESMGEQWAVAWN